MPNQITLRGCAPEPLIHYLKALGVLRLVAEQLDPNARAAWHGDTFILETTQTKDELVEFFLNCYRPAPLLSPWNGGSGFYDGDDISGREAIRITTGDRFRAYRNAIETVLRLPELPSVGHLTIEDLMSQVIQAIAESKNQEAKDVREWRKIIDDTEKQLRGFSDELNLVTRTVEQLEEIKDATGDKNMVKGFSKLLQPVKKLRTVVKKFCRAAGKDDMVKACRNRLSEEAVEWIDAAIVLFENETGEVPLLGAGGIDGKLEFARNFMARVCSVLPETIEQAVKEKRRKDLIKNAQDLNKLAKVQKQIADEIGALLQNSKQNLTASLLFEAQPILENAAVGQLQPSGAGGAPNAANTPKIDSGEGLVNPWDFILGLEGSLMLASATVRQLATGARSRASFPFTVQNSNIGYGTATDGEKVRAEMWLPLWSRFAGYGEVAHIFKEGRVQFSNRRKVRTGFDFARAVAELGVDRGIDSFQRYAFIERNGQANLATPLGAFAVSERPLAALIQQVDRWLDTFTRATSDEKKTPPRFIRARKRIEEAIFKLCTAGDSDSLRETLVALGAAEAELGNGEKFRGEKFLRPLARLRRDWVYHCDDKSDEFKLAASLATIGGPGKIGSFRSNLEPYDAAKNTWAQNSNSVVWTPAALEDNLAAVLHRRSIEARMNGAPHPSLASSRFASLYAVAAFLERETDDEKLEDYLRGLILIDWAGEKPYVGTVEKRKVPANLPRAYALLKLLFLPDGKLQSKPDPIKHEPTIVPLLRAGRITDALEIAERRLKASGLFPLTKDFYVAPEDGVRLAASLLIPLDELSIRELASLVLREPVEQ